MSDLSLKEAAVLADVPETAVRKAIAAKTVRPRVVSAGRAPRYRFRGRDLVYLKLVTGFPLALGAADKRALYALIEERRPASGRWLVRDHDLIVRNGDLALRVEVKALRSALACRLAAYRRGQRRVVSRPEVLSGEPVFEGARIPVRHIAGLIARGAPREQIVEDYPALTGDDLEFAALVARMKPNPGRPRKPLTLLRDGVTVPTTNTPVRLARAAAD